jgi:hypothetical protein
MKKLHSLLIHKLVANTFIVLCALLSFGTLTTRALSQPRNSGRLVVPIGYEMSDSVRFSLWNLDFERHALNRIATPWPGRPWSADNGVVDAYLNRFADSVQATFEGDFGEFLVNTAVAGKRKGFVGAMNDTTPYFTRLTEWYKSRTFYPSPAGPESFRFGTGNFWRYNDINFDSLASWHNNSYDANDISPYAEYPRRDSFVNATYLTKNFNGTTDTTVHYGDAGRVVLGYSDNRFANELLRVHPDDLISHETAKTFSVTLDLNIDDTTDNALAGSRPDSLLPLVKVQVLFKKGSTVSPAYPGQSILPFVPFADAAHPNNPGWYKVAEAVIDRHSYNLLNASWKCEDTLQNGSLSHPWKFKQLHLLLTDISASMRSVMKVDTGTDVDFQYYGQGSGGSAFTSFSNPDNAGTLYSNDQQKDPILEIRVLSTYRATVRVRGLDYHDTIIDKFLYRKRIAGTLNSTHSLNPNDSIGGYDSIVQARINTVPNDGLAREFLMSDTGPASGGDAAGLSIPMMAYCDFMGSRRNIHCHWHEQDDGRNITQLRRFRMIFDGQPPSMYENEITFFGAPALVFPGEYIYYSPIDTSNHTWPSVLDTFVGLRWTRRDSLSASYAAYVASISGFADIPDGLRMTNRVAVQHPNAKRMAVEGQLQGWGALRLELGTRDTNTNLWSCQNPTTKVFHFDRRYGYGGYYNPQRPTTPEETIGMGFSMLAAGICGFSSSQPLDGGTMDVFGGHSASGFGIAGIARRTFSSTFTHAELTHSYNIGHDYSWQDPWDRIHTYHIDSTHTRQDTIWQWTSKDTSDICGDLPPFYLGLSNSWRAYNRLLSRINAIYDSTNGRRCLHPYKYMTWQDGYSNSRTSSSEFYGNAVSKSNSFLKIAKTQPVKTWQRDSKGGYIDSAGVSDPISSSLVEVGTFKDSISTTFINRAAIIVNTRFYPSLRDEEDLNYYNQGLDSSQMCHPLYGDIDVRKIFMTIDTSKLDPSFQSAYYVVRDLWHPDTTWLVKCDSQFAVYIKPGDAKFLYFEKALSIKASVASVIQDSGFCFSNGHRVAERMSGTRDVITYTRNHHVYVSYPARGFTFSKAEQSGADNIATGIEVPIDTTHYCAVPAIMVARNDTGVALVYWSIDSSDKVGPVYRLRAAYQPHPDSAWTIAEQPSIDFLDDASHDLVTPVLAPIGDTTWMIAAANNPTAMLPAQIMGFKYYTPKGKPSSFDVRDTILVTGPAPGEKLYFPTCASRPLPDSKYPFRLAWQYQKKIFYARYRFDSSRFAWHDDIFEVSKGLNGCQNLHPCIATNGTRYYYPLGEGGTGTYSNVWIDDDVTWETKASFVNPLGVPGTTWMPVIRHRYQTDAISGHWGGFDVWTKDKTLSPIHWPQITAQHEQYTVVAPYILWADKQPLHDWIRATWQADSLGTIWIAGWIPGTWYTATYGELGKFPSLGQTTDSIPNWGKDSVVPRSIAFQSNTSNKGNYDVRVTNGWVPWIATAHITPTLWIFIPNDTNCASLVFNERLGRGRIGTLPIRPIEWLPSDQGRGGQFDDDWPASPRASNELHTAIFAIHGSETITLDRTLDSLALTTLRSHLATTSDYVQLRITLRRWADSSYIGTLDSEFISNAVNLTPGAGLPPLNATLTVPSDITEDSAFLMAEFTRGDTTNTLQRALVELIEDSVNVAGSYKQAAKQPIVTHRLSMTAHPNPFNPTTWLEVTGTPSLHTRLDLMDVLGRPVQTLYDSDMPESGSLHIVLNASQLASGVYFVRAISGNDLVTTRIELIK